MYVVSTLQHAIIRVRVPMGIIWVVLLFALATLAACSLPPPIQLPQSYRLSQDPLAIQLEKRVGQIAVIRADGNLAIMDQTGTLLRTVTNDATPNIFGVPNTSRWHRRYSWPVWSPDAKQLVFIETIEREMPSVLSDTHHSNPDTFSTEVLVSTVYLASGNATEPLRQLFSLDKTRITKLAWPAGTDHVLVELQEAETNQTRLYNVSVLSATNRLLASGNQLLWSWSALDEKLWVQTNFGQSAGNGGLQQWDLATLTTTNTTQTLTPLNLNLTLPKPQEKGTWVGLPGAVSAERYVRLFYADKTSYLYLLGQNGKVVREIDRIVGNIHYWVSPDGKHVAYALFPAEGNRFATQGLLYSVSTQDNATLSEKIDYQLQTSHVLWSPDSQRFLVLERANFTDIPTNFVGVNLAKQDTVDFELFLVHSVWRGQNSGRELFYLYPNKDFLQMIKANTQQAHGVWSPDSRKIVLPYFVMGVDQNRKLSNRPQLLQSEAGGSIEPRILPPALVAVWSAN